METPANALRVLPLSLLLALSGCAGDNSLRVAPDLPDDPLGEAVAVSGEPGAGGQGGSSAGGPASPWGDLDPGDLPDTVFAVAWVDLTEGCVNCYYAENAPNRYDIIDPLGQVISSFTPPFDWEEISYYPPALRAIEASGPGRFIASNVMQGNAEFHQIVWEGDAYTGEARVLARIYSRRIELPQTGELLLFTDELWPWDMRVMPDPEREGALLMVPTMSSPYMPVVLREVLSVPYDDPAAPVRRWSVSEFAPQFGDEWPVMESAGLARLADDGSGRLVLGLDAWSQDEDGVVVQTSELTSFVPTGDLEVQRDAVPPELLHPDSRVVPGDDDTSAIVLAPPMDCAGPFTWWEDGVSTELPMAEGDWCPTLGPLLDLPSRTFVYTAWTDEEEYPDAMRVVVSAAGQEVWSIDRFKRGLSERPFHLLGAAALQR